MEKLEFNSLKDLLTYNIKYYRYYRNMSQEKLAELCSLSPKYIADIEQGRHCPTIDKIEIIAKSLNIDPFILFQNQLRDLEIIERIKNNRQYNQKKILQIK